MTDQPAERLRFATWNVEWFNALFDDRGHVLFDNELSARYKTTRRAQLAAIATVWRAMDADAVMVIEAPDTNGRRSSVKALEKFAAKAGLRTTRAVTGFRSDTEQEITLVYDPSRLTAVHDPQGNPAKGATGVPRFDGGFRFDAADAPGEMIRHSKPPLELALTTAGGRRCRMIGVHAKSKAPHGARDDAEAKRIGIENRRKQLAQCVWIRQRVAMHLAAGDPLIVLGDFNDGPGLDDYEKLFGRSGVEVVLAADAPPEMRLFDPHAAMVLGRKIGIMPTTARFYLDREKRYFEALLDFIMLSPDLVARAPDWRIWHPFNDPGCMNDPDLREALLTASDHFPVTVDVSL